MEFLYLVVFTISAFTLLTILRKYIDSFILIAFAIGGVVNANFYTSANYPITIGNCPFIFSINSVLFTIFMFTVLLKYLFYPLKDTKIMIYSSICAIIISAFIDFFAKLAHNGYDTSDVSTLILYLVSALSSLFCCWLMLLLLKIFEKKKISRYISLSICMLIGSVINSTLFFFAQYLLNLNSNAFDNFINMLIGSYIGKIVSIGLCLVSYWINSKYLIPKELQNEKVSDN